MKKVGFLIPFFLVFYSFLFFNFNNKTLLLILITSGFVLYRKLKDIKLVLWVLYLLVLPFEKGKGFSFTLLPSYMTHQMFPYRFWFTITFADLFIFFLIYFFIREEIVSNWKIRRIKIKQQDFLLFSFLLISFLTVFISQFQIVSFLAFIRLVRMVFAYFAVRKILQDKEIIKPTVLILASSLVFQGVWAILQFLRQGLLGRDLEQIGEFFSPFGHLTAEEPAIFRATGTFVHPNSLASFLTILLSMVFIKLFDGSLNKKEERFFLLSFVMGGLGLLFTASRAAWGTIVLILVLASLFLYQKRQLVISKTVKGWLGRFLLIIGVFLPILIIPRMLSLYQSFQKYGGAYYRIDLIKKAFELNIRNPLGIGLEVFPAVFVYEFGEFFTQPAPVHNLFLQILVALGIPGLVIFLTFLILSYKHYFLGLKEEKLFFLKTPSFFASLSFLGLGIFYPLFLVTNLSEYFWLFLGMLSL